MAATTADPLWPGAATFPNTNVYPGQGLFPILRCRLSFDDMTVPTPAWSEVANSKFRSYSISRGRDNELSDIPAGTATVVLDNRDRTYDPNVNASVRPMNRVWLYEEYSAEVQTLFKGYATAWTQDWPGGGWSDATATIAAADEMLVLSLDNLAATNPPSASYGDLIQSDQPEGYWPMSADAGETQTQPEPPLQIPPGGFDVRQLKGGWKRWRKWQH